MADTFCRECNKEVRPDTKFCPRCGIDRPGVKISRRGDVALGIFLALIAAFASAAWWWVDTRPPDGAEGSLLGISLVATASAVVSLVIFLNSSWSVERRGIAAVTLLISTFTLFHSANVISFSETQRNEDPARTPPMPATAHARLLESERAFAAGDFATLIKALAAIPQHERDALGERYAVLQDSADHFTADRALTAISADDRTNILEKLSLVRSQWQALTRQKPPSQEVRRTFEDTVLALVERIPSSNPEWRQAGYSTLEEIAPENPAYTEMTASLPQDPLAQDTLMQTGAIPPAGVLTPDTAFSSTAMEPGLALRGSVEDDIAGAADATGAAMAEFPTVPNPDIGPPPGERPPPPEFEIP